MNVVPGPVEIAGERSQAHTAEFLGRGGADASWNPYHCNLLAPSAYSKAPNFSEFLDPQIYTLISHRTSTNMYSLTFRVRVMLP